MKPARQVGLCLLSALGLGLIGCRGVPLLPATALPTAPTQMTPTPGPGGSGGKGGAASGWTGTPTVSTPSPIPGATNSCRPAPTPTPGPLTWRQIRDDWYRYAFEIPSGWYEDPNVTPDRRGFVSDAAQMDPSYCPSPMGWMKLDFAADPPGKFQPNMQPNLEGMTPITVAGRPAWILTEAAPDLWMITVYISGPDYWYQLWLGCTPAGSDAATRDPFIAECQRIMDHILESFQILPQ